MFTQCTSQPPDFSETDWYEKTLAADSALLYARHQDADGAFFCPWLQRDGNRRSGSWLFHKRREYEKVPVEKYGSLPNDYAYLSDNNFDSITFAGHASMIVKMDGQTVFTDPFFSKAALVRQKKVKIKFDFSKVPENPVVLLSHNHYDHLDRYSVRKLAKKGAVFIVPLGLKKHVTGLGAKDVRELDWWQSAKVGSIEYTFLPAQHWSLRMGQKGGSTLWGGFLIQGSKNIYFSGDTGYFAGFKEFGRRWNIDYALLGAGAYEPRWFMHYSHMNVQEFFRSAEDLNAKCAIPMHFGIISLSDEPLLYPLFEIDNYIKENVRSTDHVRPLRVGGYLRLE
jgi:L-ascorbate metabolism protein UlaG (beta-lactamase superfamily)